MPNLIEMQNYIESHYTKLRGIPVRECPPAQICAVYYSLQSRKTKISNTKTTIKSKRGD